MPKRTDIHKVLVIGSGPIVIGQAAEFDYAGTQACLALREEGYEVVLINSNPATIMTDTDIADKVYMEPLNLEYVARIIRHERPDAILPSLGGQTGLNLAVQLAKKGVLQECDVEILGTSFESIERAEDRELFKELCQGLGEPVLPSEIAETLEDGLRAAAEIGYPVVLRPAFTLGGTGGGFADDEEECRVMLKNALALSPVHQVLVEKSIKGYKEVEYEDSVLTALEGLYEEDYVIDMVERKNDMERLENIYKMLTEEEQYLIYMLYLAECPLSESELAKGLHISQPAVHKRKKKILKKLKGL